MHRLIRHAATEHAIELPDPYAVLGREARVRAAAPLGLLVTSVEKQTFVEPLGDDPRAAFDKVIDYGFVEPLRRLSHDLREIVFATYERAYLAALKAGDGGQDVLFTTCRTA